MKRCNFTLVNRSSTEFSIPISHCTSKINMYGVSHAAGDMFKVMPMLPLYTIFMNVCFVTKK